MVRMSVMGCSRSTERMAAVTAGASASGSPAVRTPISIHNCGACGKGT